ncbi:MAG: 50S ribosomal protein L23 [Planctomycetaceae bacterium]|nr:50S ribosomal protein L23 [Planctomycetaceae bacterium]
MARDATKTGLELEPHQIILRPLVTEKGMHKASRNNAYAFEVSRMAGKADVRRAVEQLFDVKVVGVNIQNRKGKPRRSRFRGGATNAWKKAIVTLDPEHRINFF